MNCIIGRTGGKLEKKTKREGKYVVVGRIKKIKQDVY